MDIFNFFRKLLIGLSLPFYWVSEILFKVFFMLAKGELFETSNYSLLINNTYIIIGIVMLFVVAFSILKSMVNPDDQKQGTTVVKKIILNTITSSVIMVLLPTIFVFAFDLQKSVIGSEYNVIGNFFGFGSSNTEAIEGENSDVTQAAYTMINSIYTAFFNVNPQTYPYSTNEELEKIQGNIKSDDGETNFLATIREVNSKGNTRAYMNYTEAWSNDEIEFNLLLSIICGCILIYVIASFCIDMAVRYVKLIFYQLIAPIPIFFRIIPDGKLSGTFKQWIKVTLTCYFEVFLRILIVYFCLWICVQVKGSQLLKLPWEGNLVFNAFIYLGIITFMRQAPKLISEITGLDTGNMKIGIRDKLAEGGAFTAGAILGGAATAGVRNATNAWGNRKKNYDDAIKNGRTKFGATASVFAKSAGSVIAGTASAAVRSGKAGLSAKNTKDMKSAASSGASAAVDASDKRESYKASHGNKIGGVISGHIEDRLQTVQEWAGIGTGDATLGYYSTAAQATNSFNDLSESTYKKKQEYIDKSSVVKSLESKLDAYKKKTPQELAALGITEADIEKVQAELDLEQEALKTLQRKMAYKKKDIISIAATKLSVDQKVNYLNNPEFVETFNDAVYKGLKLDYDGYTRTEKDVTTQWINPVTGKQEDIQTKEYEFKNSKGDIITRTLTPEEMKIMTALLNGEQIDDRWITPDNVEEVQDIIDKANIGRQHIKTIKERDHIEKTGNRSTDKKDK